MCANDSVTSNNYFVPILECYTQWESEEISAELSITKMDAIQKQRRPPSFPLAVFVSHATAATPTTTKTTTAITSTKTPLTRMASATKARAQTRHLCV